MSLRPLAIGWTLAIAVACTVPGTSLPEYQFLPFSVDKWVHIGLFVGFGALWTWTAPERWRAVAAAGLAFGFAIEVWQDVLPIGRSGDPLDFAADLIGLALGIGLARWLGNVRPQRVSR